MIMAGNSIEYSATCNNNSARLQQSQAFPKKGGGGNSSSSSSCFSSYAATEALDRYLVAREREYEQLYRRRILRRQQQQQQRQRRTQQHQSRMAGDETENDGTDNVVSVSPLLSSFDTTSMFRRLENLENNGASVVVEDGDEEPDPVPAFPSIEWVASSSSSSLSSPLSLSDDNAPAGSDDGSFDVAATVEHSCSGWATDKATVACRSPPMSPSTPRLKRCTAFQDSLSEMAIADGDDIGAIQSPARRRRICLDGEPGSRGSSCGAPLSSSTASTTSASFIVTPDQPLRRKVRSYYGYSALSPPMALPTPSSSPQPSPMRRQRR